MASDSSNVPQLLIEKLRSTLRPGQLEMAQWQSGSLAVSAVPGAGKSYGLSVAAAIALSAHPRPSNQQLILVTFTRSAALNLKRKVREHLKTLQISAANFSVHTLHGLALTIANQHPQDSGIRLDQLTLVSPSQSNRLIRATVDHWISAHLDLYQTLLVQGSFDGEETEKLRRQSVLRTEVLPALAHTAIREAKSSGLSPEDLFQLAEAHSNELPVLTVAAGLFQQYEKRLGAHNQMDYDDMIRAALRALNNDEIRALWRSRVFAIFEDEAQDSSPLQSQLLEIIATRSPHSMNLLRVGDPNQAINSTFTPADPSFFRKFCVVNAGQGTLAKMNQAGRSAPAIINAANFFQRWVNQSHLAGTIQPFEINEIFPLPKSSENSLCNPAPLGNGVEIHYPQDIFETTAAIGQRILDLANLNPQLSFAILVRENKQGHFLSEVLSNPAPFNLKVDLAQNGIQVYDPSGHQSQSSVPQHILTLLQFLTYPHSPDCLKAALTLLIQRQIIAPIDLNQLSPLPENFLAPTALQPVQPQSIQTAQRFCAKLLRARWELPRFQLIPFLALCLNYSAAELATADKLATRLAQQAAGDTSMKNTLNNLQELIDSERFDPVELDDDRFVRDRQVTILTMHKAKGLDWDVVFLPFLHRSIFPGTPWIPSQARFLGEFSLAEVARAQIRAWIHQDPVPTLSEAWEMAKNLKIAEEFRLLYVAMTRPKKLLWMSACKQAPFRWGSYSWDRQDPLTAQLPLDILSDLGKMA